MEQAYSGSIKGSSSLVREQNIHQNHRFQFHQQFLSNNPSIQQSSGSTSSVASNCPTSAFKPVVCNQIDFNLLAKCKIKLEDSSNIPPSLTSKKNLNSLSEAQHNHVEFCSSSSSSSSSSTSTAAVNKSTTASSFSAANQACGQSPNPFYIDKIFNFQNMFLFSGGSHGPNSNGSMQSIPNDFPSTNSLSSLSMPQQPTQPPPPPPVPQATQSSHLAAHDLTALFQQNFLHHLYASSIELVRTPKVEPLNVSGIGKSVSNFSIERILSLPSRQNKGKESAASESGTSSYTFAASTASTLTPSIPTLANNVPTYCKKLNLPPLALTAPLPPSLAAFNSRIHRSAENNNHNCSKNGQRSKDAASILKPTTVITGYDRPASSSIQIGTNSAMLPTTAANNVPASTTTTKSKNAKKYKCDLCGRGFSRSNTLITHRRIHTGEKPFECNICGRAFRQPGNLTRHKLTHTTIKPYSCNKCGKSFNRVSNLHAHIKIHSDGKPYVCIVCGCGFYQKVDLKIHALSHSSDKIHECSFCKRTFKQAAHLKYHLHSHLKQFDKFEAGQVLKSSPPTSPHINNSRHHYSRGHYNHKNHHLNKSHSQNQSSNIIESNDRYPLSLSAQGEELSTDDTNGNGIGSNGEDEKVHEMTNRTPKKSDEEENEISEMLNEEIEDDEEEDEDDDMSDEEEDEDDEEEFVDDDDDDHLNLGVSSNAISTGDLLVENMNNEDINKSSTNGVNSDRDIQK